MRANEVIRIASAELGTKESPAGSNRTKYGAFYGADGYPWCAMFLWWVFEKAGGAPWLKTAYTPTLADWFQGQGRWRKTPRRGALVFFDFPDSESRIQHVGIVTDPGPPVKTIEGNTSSGDGGSQDNGGGVFRRVRSSYIVGYGYPNYADAVGPGRPAGASGRVSLRLQDQGADVKTLQIDLNAWRRQHSLPAIGADGIFGGDTERAVSRFQQIREIRPNGIADRDTLRSLDAWRDAHGDRDRAAL